MEFIYSLSLALKDFTQSDIRKKSLLNGIVWAIVWLILTFMLWNDVFLFTTKLINFLPSTFIQNTGVDFLLVIFWIQLVLISLGIIFSLFNQLLTKKFLPIILSLTMSVFWIVVFYFYKDSVVLYLHRLLKIFPFQTIEEIVAVILCFFVFYSLYVASVYVSFVFLISKNIEDLQQTQYPNIQIEKNFSFWKLFLVFARDLLIYFILLFVTYPLLFVPFLNILLVIGLWALLIKEVLLRSVFMLFGEIDINRKIIWMFSIVSVVFNFIPIVNLFAPAFGLLSIYHYVLEKKND